MVVVVVVIKLVVELMAPAATTVECMLKKTYNICASKH